MGTHIAGRDLDVLTIQQGGLFQATVVLVLQGGVEALLVEVDDLACLLVHTKRVTCQVLQLPHSGLRKAHRGKEDEHERRVSTRVQAEWVRARWVRSSAGGAASHWRAKWGIGRAGTQ